MKRAFLHIGLSKTGTTAIQTSLSESRQTLSHNGVLYPGTEVDHALLLPTFHQLGPDHYRYRNAGVSPADAQRQSSAFVEMLTKEAEGFSGDLLLSSEYLQNMNPAAWEKLKSFIEGLGYEPHVICYVRHPVSHATSSIQQNVKMGFKPLEEQLTTPNWPRARPHLQPVLKVFPKDNVHLRRFEDARQDGIEIHILKAIGYSGPLDQIARSEANSSLSMTGVMLADARTRMNLEGQNADEVNKFLFRIGGSKFSLPPRTVKRVMEMAKDDLAWLKKTFGISFDDIQLSQGRRRAMDEKSATDLVKLLLMLDGLSD